MSIFTDNRYLFNKTSGEVFKELDRMAQSGQIDPNQLHNVNGLKAVVQDREIRYYLASLYLLIDEQERAHELLMACRAGREMKRYFAVLNYCVNNSLPVPGLTTDEIRCIEYLNSSINPQHGTLEQEISDRGGFAIVGNAPGSTEFAVNTEHCAIYFNDYHRNPRIKHTASVHVVTPSWKDYVQSDANALCITGCSIFHRRSRVWQRFINHRHHQSIYTLPVSLWSRLNQQLAAAPSAGILMIGFVTDFVQSNPLVAGHLQGYVGGFSKGVPQVNHSYNNVPASSRHNWLKEQEIFHGSLNVLRDCCSQFSSEE